MSHDFKSLPLSEENLLPVMNSGIVKIVRAKAVIT